MIDSLRIGGSAMASLSHRRCSFLVGDGELARNPPPERPHSARQDSLLTHAPLASLLVLQGRPDPGIRIGANIIAIDIDIVRRIEGVG